MLAAVCRCLFPCRAEQLHTTLLQYRSLLWAVRDAVPTIDLATVLLQQLPAFCP